MGILVVSYIIICFFSLVFSQVPQMVPPGREPSGRRGDVLSLGNIEEQVIFNVDNSQDNGGKGPGTPGGPGGPSVPGGPGRQGGPDGPGGPGRQGGPNGPEVPGRKGGPSAPAGQCVLPPGKTVEQARAECMCDGQHPVPAVPKPQPQQQRYQTDYDYPSYE